MKTLFILILICGTTYGAENIEYNKSIATLITAYSQAESNILKNSAEYLHKLVTIKELQEKIRAAQLVNESKELENEMKEAQQFYAKRKLYQENNKREPVKSLGESRSNEKLVLFSMYTSRWPTIFDQEQFDQIKGQIEQLMKERTPEDSGLGSNNYNEISQNIEKIKEVLKDYIDSMKPIEYLIAKRFLENLDIEAQLISIPRDKLVSYKKGV